MSTVVAPPVDGTPGAGRFMRSVHGWAQLLPGSSFRGYDGSVIANLDHRAGEVLFMSVRRASGADMELNVGPPDWRSWRHQFPTFTSNVFEQTVAPRYAMLPPRLTR